jgi:hypothetical protein
MTSITPNPAAAKLNAELRAADPEGYAASDAYKATLAAEKYKAALLAGAPTYEELLEQLRVAKAGAL